MTNRELGKIVVAARQLRGWDQKTLADAIGVSASSMCRWEKGVYALDVPTLLDIAKALDLPIAHFLPLDNQEEYWHVRYVLLLHSLKALTQPVEESEEKKMVG